MSPEELVRVCPRVYHMAWAGAWPSIQRHGLLSTNALLDLFEVDNEQRDELVAAHRRHAVGISHPIHGVATIRDQKPMSDSGLRRCLEDGLKPEDWYRLLNQRIFFWPTKARLEGLLAARAYRGDRHTVLSVDTRQLVKRHGSRVELTTLNTGCTVPFPWPRGFGSFTPLREFDYEESRKRRGTARAIAEVAVLYGVWDVADFVTRAELRGGGLPTELQFENDRDVEG